MITTGIFLLRASRLEAFRAVFSCQWKGVLVVFGLDTRGFITPEETVAAHLHHLVGYAENTSAGRELPLSTERAQNEPQECMKKEFQITQILSKS